jgi:RNA polymerase sigma-70 factor (ECF subfamily)
VQHAEEQRFASLMQRYQAGEEEAFAELYRQTSEAMRRYLTRWVSPSKVGDLVQETYLQVHRARRTYRPELPFRPWLYAIARHVAQQSLRTHARKTAREVQPEEGFDVAAPSEEARVVTRDELEQALARLPLEQREAVWLAEVEGLTSAEISRLTGASEGAIRVRIHRANQKLRAFLRGPLPQMKGGRNG